MCLWGGQEGEVVATVGDSRVHNGQSIPQPGDREVGPHDDWPQGYWEIVGENLFHRVAVDGGYSSRCRPLMVCLVNVFVETRVMEEPVKGRGRKRKERLYLEGLKNEPRYSLHTQNQDGRGD